MFFFRTFTKNYKSSIYGYIIITSKFAGYKAVIESFAYFQKAIPMMMTAAGTIPAAKVLVVGAGVAGFKQLQLQKEWEQ